MSHDKDLAQAFDGQAARFEKAPVQNDPLALQRLVQFAALAPDSLVLDAGCGPGIVSDALLSAGHRVVGVDLSTQMLERARARCARFGDRARFVQTSVLQLSESGFDAALSRLVVHHVEDPLAFVSAQVQRVRRGGAVIVCDHVTDPDPGRAAWHQHIERARDKTHTHCLTTGGIADLLATAALADLQLAEDEFTLDFDEWFDRGTPALSKEEVRALIESGTARGFAPQKKPGGALAIVGVRTMARGVRR